jgi:hypothetical protein
VEQETFVPPKRLGGRVAPGPQHVEHFVCGLGGEDLPRVLLGRDLAKYRV